MPAARARAPGAAVNRARLCAAALGVNRAPCRIAHRISRPGRAGFRSRCTWRRRAKRRIAGRTVRRRHSPCRTRRTPDRAPEPPAALIRRDRDRSRRAAMMPAVVAAAHHAAQKVLQNTHVRSFSMFSRVRARRPGSACRRAAPSCRRPPPRSAPSRGASRSARRASSSLQREPSARRRLRRAPRGR